MGVPYAEVIGDPIAHSKSPLIHNFWLGKLGLPGEYRALRVRPDELAAYVEERKADKSWRGCNVTSPHKVAIVELVPFIGDIRGTFGAINTVFRHTLDIPMGTNTDGVGVAAAIRRHFEEQGILPWTLAVQIIGAGGAALGALAGLSEMGFRDFYFYNRSPEKARALAERAGLDPDRHAAGLEALGPISEEDRSPIGRGNGFLVLNASAMGMEGKPAVPIDLSAYPAGTVVFDAVYAPLETPLLKSARDCGLATLDGLRMLVEQADRAFTMFFRHRAPRQHDDELRELLIR